MVVDAKYTSISSEDKLDVSDAKEGEMTPFDIEIMEEQSLPPVINTKKHHQNHHRSYGFSKATRLALVALLLFLGFLMMATDTDLDDLVPFLESSDSSDDSSGSSSSSSDSLDSSDSADFWTAKNNAPSSLVRPFDDVSSGMNSP